MITASFSGTQLANFQEILLDKDSSCIYHELVLSIYSWVIICIRGNEFPWWFSW